jgi:hypothetical protein
VIDGKLETLAEAEKKYKEYLKLFNFMTPAYKTQADEMITLIQQISKPQKYKVKLLKAKSVGEIHEENPDLYLRIFVNKKIIINTKDNIKTNDRNPVWNLDFEVTWKAFDQVQIELYDAENILVNDVLIKPYLFNSLFSGDKAFNSIVYPSNKGTITIYFEWQGPKRN